MEAAEKVCAGDDLDPLDVLELLGHLVDKSLVIVGMGEGETRYRMLETIRHYAREKVFESGESEMLRDGLLQFFLKFVEDANLHMRGADENEWLDRVEADHDNLRLALDWDQGAVHRAPSQLRLAAALSGFWSKRGYLVEGREKITAALDHARALDGTALYANALCAAGWTARFQGDFTAARSFANHALTIYRKVQDRSGMAEALVVLAEVAIDNKEFVEAESLLEQALRLREQSNDDAGMTDVLLDLGWSAFGRGEYELARKRIDQALAIFLDQGDKGAAATALGGLAEIDLREGRYQDATKRIEQALAIQRKIGDK
jgi:non-specific serine/threonine protein kinase